MEDLTFPSIAMRIPDEDAAYQFLEELRWKGRPVCPHCGSINQHYFLKPRDGVRKTNRGTTTQRRLWKCRDCRKPFSVITNTVMHGTHVPIRTWIFLFYELCSNKNGLAAREVERKYGLSPKTAWFVLHRIREAMKREPLAGLLSGTIVADETWIGGNPKNKHRGKTERDGHGWMTKYTDKTPVVSLINSETGEVRSQVVAKVNAGNLRAIMDERVDMNASVLHTDGAQVYKGFRGYFAEHHSVDHVAGEYVRDGVSTNRAENYFSQLKRSVDGTHHHVSVEHLPRYLAEFDFRYSTCDMTDTQRMDRLMGKVAGKRLTYRPITSQDD
ncbi:MAG TPA: IS1595 family transposase [Acidimicrobiales bacterium]|nr:IS1595 family transposase [Acidimicrobiales bacterium]